MFVSQMSNINIVIIIVVEVFIQTGSHLQNGNYYSFICMLLLIIRTSGVVFGTVFHFICLLLHLWMKDAAHSFIRDWFLILVFVLYTFCSSNDVRIWNARESVKQRRR